MTDELIDKLKEIFNTSVFEVNMKNYGHVKYKIDRFFVRFEKLTKDIILYIKPEFYDVPDSNAVDRKTNRLIEKSLEHKLYKYGVQQVIIPFSNFFEMLSESINKNSTKKEVELSSFIYSKLKNRKFKLKMLNHDCTFKIHPYFVENDTLIFDVRNFSLENENGSKEIGLKHFKPLIEKEILDVISHLGIKDVEMVINNRKKTEALLEQAGEDNMKFVDGKKFINYMTPEGMFSFIIADPVVEDDVLKFYIKKFHGVKGGEVFYEVDPDMKPYINTIVGDEVAMYNFPNVKFMGQENTIVT